jgi:hypothetical protein
MYRGTTPSNIFTSDLDLSAAEVVYITYKQNGNTVFEKDINDITFSTNETNGYCVMTVELTQAETLAFINANVVVQIRARFADGRAVASNTVVAPVKEILKDGEI